MGRRPVPPRRDRRGVGIITRHTSEGSLRMGGAADKPLGRERLHNLRRGKGFEVGAAGGAW